MALAERFRSLFRSNPVTLADITESATAPTVPERSGYAPGVPPGGLNEYRQSIGAATGTDRRSSMIDLYGAYLSCPWVWTAVQAIARTITAGGLITDWDTDTGEGTQDAPDKPPAVLALERLFAFCSPDGDIRQLLRNIVVDLLVFGDAYIEVTWVAGIPVALYNLDSPTMYPTSNEHGTVTEYVQITEWGQRATFKPNEVIHIGMDAPRSGVFGVSPTQAAMLPITAWLHAAATGKEMMRKGLPPLLHVDFPQGHSEPDQRKWLARFMQRNIGPKNIGTPIATVGGGKIVELASGRVADVETYLNQKRDEILSVFGVPPAKAGVIESGNLGGGTGDAQDKALDLATVIPTPTGWTTMGALKIGDQVLDEAGNPCNVIGTYEVPDAESWRFHFSDGTFIDCCSDHLWVTWTEKDRKAYGRSVHTDSNALPEDWPTWRSGRGAGPRIRRGEEIVNSLKSRPGVNNHTIPVAGELQLPDMDLPIDPYTLGVWLGDGTSVNSSITCGIGDEQMIDEIRAAGYGITERMSARNSGRTPTYNVTGLMTALRAAGVLGDKHVPVGYLRASAQQRLGLLQGLMDADGGFSSGQQALFRSTNEHLADAVVELARSLGQKPVKAKGRAMLNGVDCGPQFGVTWTPTIQVFRLARKADKWKPSTTQGMRLLHRTIVDAEKIPDRPMRCIRVDSPNAMYLAGEAMIPTHNTFKVNTCQPIAELILEKLNYAIARVGFGITDWHAKFRDIDYRDSTIIETIRDMRLRNGSWTQNRLRSEIGEPPIKGGDDAVLIDRQNLVLWSDMADMSAATVAGKGAPAVAAGAPTPIADPLQVDAQQESAPLTVPEAWEREYRQRFKSAMRELQEVG